MENRFAFKDFILTGLLIAIIVLIILSMIQFDRQFEIVRQTNLKLQEQTGDLSRIRRLLEQHIAVRPPTADTAQPATTTSADGWIQPPFDSFSRMRKTHSAPDFAEGDAIIDTFAVVPEKLTPLISSDLYSAYVQSAVLDTLCERDPTTLKYVPRLATAWRISDDQLTIDFRLRRGVTFSDGEPLTADDVVFTLKLTQDEKIEAPRARVYLDRLKSCEKLDDYTVRFVFKEPYFKSFDTAAGTQVLSKKFYSRFSPTDFNRSTGLLIGSGPYRLADPESWRPEPGKPVQLLRNERFWGDVAPALKRMSWRIIQNPTARVTALRNGEIDLFTQPESEQYAEMIHDSNLAARTKHFDLPSPLTGYIYIGWNQKRDGKPTHFTDPRVRRALTMLIDRERIVRDITQNLATVNTGPFSFLSPQADPSIKPWPYDPPAAMKLLEEAGFKKKADTLYGPDGKEFRFSLAYNTQREARRRICSLVKDSLATVGIIVDVEPTEWSVLLKRTKDKQFDAVCIGWSGVIEEDPSQIFHTKAMAGTGDNTISYSNPVLDKLIDKACTIVKEDERLPVWHEVHRIIHEEQPYTFLYQEKELTVLDNRFKGMEPTRLGLSPSGEWYVPAQLQKYKD